MAKDSANPGRRERAARLIERMQLEAEAALPPMDVAAFRERREKAILDALGFVPHSIARPEGAWRFEVDDETLRDIVGRLHDVMSVVRTLTVVPDVKHRADVERVRRHMASLADPAFQSLLRGLQGSAVDGRR